MNFDYSDEQIMLRDSVDRYGAEQWAAANRLKMLEEGPEAAVRRWAQMAEMGWLMLPIGEDQGGLGGSAVDVMAIAEGFGRHLILDPWVTSCVLVPALLRGGGDAAGDVAAAIAAGEARAAAALIESDGGYDLAHVATRADGNILSGAKLHVEDGADADWFVVSARTGGSVDEDGGISLFLVPRGAEGLEISRYRALDHHRHARLTLNGVRGVPIGQADAALPVIEAGVDRAICAHLAEATGSMETAAAVTLEYLKTRKQFGVAIGTFQALQHKMVDMTIACEEARAMTYHATLHLGAAPAERRRAVAAGKTRVADCGVHVGQDAIQLHGGVGFSDELIVSHHFKRQLMIDQAHGPRAHHRARFSAAR